jgi:segregation and condensation protein B
MEEIEQALETERADEEQTESIIIEDDALIADSVSEEPQTASPTTTLRAVIEAAIYITEEPLTAEQIAAALEQPVDLVKTLLQELVADYASPARGLSIREIAGGYKMSTKPEHHELIRRFVNKLQPPLKLSQAALETLAVIAYKQPITGPEILEIRGVQGAGVVKTLLDRKLIAAAGRKDILGKPILYKTTREFLVQFGLNSLAELPTLKEFEELGRFALSENDEPAAETTLDVAAVAEESGAAAEPEVNNPEPETEAPVAAAPVEEPSSEPAPSEEEPVNSEPAQPEVSSSDNQDSESEEHG